MAKQTITRKQVDALFETIIACKPTHYVCEGILGKGSVPALSDFTSRHAADLLKCEKFLSLLKDAASLIEADVKGRERQGEMFDPETNKPTTPTTPAKGSKKKKKKKSASAAKTDVEKGATK